MNVKIRIPQKLEALIRRDLARPHRFAAERIGFLFTRNANGQDVENPIVFGESYEPVDDAHYIDDPSVGARINSNAIRRVMQNVITGEKGAFHVHLHDQYGVPKLSWVDRQEIHPLMSSVRNAGRSLVHGLLILSNNSAYAEVLPPNAKDFTPARLTVVGFPTSFHSYKSHIAVQALDFSRQTFLGDDAQARISSCQVGVVGLGGGGSHIVQQLAHIGFERFVLFDHDTVEVSNLNRLVGATEKDARLQVPKTKVAARMCESLNRDSDVVMVQKRWQEAPELLRNCDLIFGCVDSYLERRELEVFARRNLIPYIDIGIDVNHSAPEPPRMAGQVILSMPGEKCMSCLGFLTADKFAREAERYGAAGPRPQVVWANGILASTAVGIAVDLLTDWTQSLRGPVYLSYDSNTGTIQPHKRLLYVPAGDCPHFPNSEVGEPVFRKL